MCGLVGIASTSLSPYERDTFKKLMILSSFRGTDSSGSFFVSRKGAFNSTKFRINVHKNTENPLTYVESEEFDKKLKDTQPFLIAGHTRFATVGDIKTSNAHPFSVNGFTGMHNGSVKTIPVPDGKTDSEEIYRLISTIGLEETLKKIRGGAYCLVFINHKDRTLNFIRNHDRPLHYMITKTNCLIWASEERMLEFIKKDLTYNEQSTEIKSLPVDTLMTVPFGKVTPTFTKLDLAVPYIPLLPGPTSAIIPSKPTGGINRTTRMFNSVINPIEYSRVYPYVDDRKKESTEATKTDSLKTTKVNYTGYKHLVYAYNYATNKLASGCACCKHKAEVTDTVWWTDYNTYYCDECYTDNAVKEYFSLEKIEVFKGELKHVIN